MYIYIYMYTVEGNNFATFEQYMFKKSSQTKNKPQSPVTPGIKVVGRNMCLITPLRKETILQLSTLSEGVGGDMARDTYEMTSPRRVLHYALRVAKYIPPTVSLSLSLYIYIYIYSIYIYIYIYIYI